MSTTRAETSVVGRALAHPRALLGIVLLAALLALPSVSVGFYADDHALRASLSGALPNRVPFWDLYHFVPESPEANRALVAAGGIPWWTSEEMRLHLIRPLSSVLFTLDTRVFGASPLGSHLHSIVWYLGLVLAVGALFRRLFQPPTATLALLVFAVSGAHVMPFAWISARHILVAAVPAVLAIIVHLRATDEGWTLGRFLCPVLLCIGLAGSEVGLAGVAFIVAHSLFGPPDAKVAGARARFVRALPTLSLGVAYLVLYRLAGGGAAASGAYLEPLSSPGLFLRAAADRLPTLLGNAIFGVPSELATAFSHVPFVILGLAGVVMLALLWRASAASVSTPERAALRWLGVGALLSLLASLGGLPGSRQLVLPNLFFAPLFAVLIRHGLSRHEGGALSRAASRAGAGLLILIHLIGGPISGLGAGRSMTTMARNVDAIAQSPALSGPGNPRVFLVAAADPMLTLYTHAARVDAGPRDLGCWSTLSAAKTTHRVTRTADRTLVLTAPPGELLSGAFETLYRDASRPIATGYEATQCGALFRVAESSDGHPTRVEVTFDASLDSPSILLITWENGELHGLRLGIGESRDLPWSPGPMGFL